MARITSLAGLLIMLYASLCWMLFSKTMARFKDVFKQQTGFWLIRGMSVEGTCYIRKYFIRIFANHASKGGKLSHKRRCVSKYLKFRLGFFSLWVNSSWFCCWFNQAFFGKIYDAFPLVTFLAWYKCSTFWVVADVDKLITISISAITWMEEYTGNW